ncbi:MAG: MamI family restriction endonuclease [Pseudomonadota bacterium]
MNANSNAPEIKIGTPQAAEELLTDLYVRLRRDLQRWALVTKQTPQPRMGYVGQHLVSVVTGHPGSRSGARGDDLQLDDGTVAEIKCCYRVDQLGACIKCGTAVASIEKICPNAACGSRELTRKDDSKWLLSPKSEKELEELFVPTAYYLVLFEFSDLQAAEDIDVFIYRVDPNSLGFSLCMIDYFFNIRANSKSGAPFNLWPDSPKFHLMRPELIYWSIIKPDDSIDTRIFPGRDPAQLQEFGDFTGLAGAKTISDDAIVALGKAMGVDVSVVGKELPRAKMRFAKLKALQEVREKDGWSAIEVADQLARAVYRPLLVKLASWTDRFSPTL